MRTRSGYVTIAKNLFEHHNKVMLFFNHACDPIPAGCKDDYRRQNPGPSQPLVHVTLYNNVFWGTSQRHPKIGLNVFVHAVDNLVAYRQSHYPDGSMGAAYGISVMDGGYLLAEGNAFMSMTANARPAISTMHNEDSLKIGSGPGYIKTIRNYPSADELIEERHPEYVPEPPYKITPLRLKENAFLSAAACILGSLMNENCRE